MNSSAPDKDPMADGVLDPVADAYRRWGYLQADLDALGRLEPYVHPDIAAADTIGDPGQLERLRAAYCGHIGIEFGYMADADRQRWLAMRMEGEVTPVDQQALLTQIATAELFERFLHARYVGSKRYSIEGVAGLIPLMESMLDCFAAHGGEYAVIAMSHRGRLNMMANIVGTPGAEMFAEQEDVDPKSLLGSGDVKYHMGATGRHTTVSGDEMRIHLVSNPSHLEAVDPVVAGRVRAKHDRAGSGGAQKIVAITLHGDAAFAGQGITAETLNLAKLEGYDIGGTVHVIVNNLIGFTAEPMMLHTARFSAELARRQSLPIIHVNGEDPEAIWRAGHLALDYRNTFGDDVVVDLIGYRRYGHSEVEDPSTTQPLLYRRISGRPMLYELYAQQLGVQADALEQMRDKQWQRLTAEQEQGRHLDYRPTLRTLPSYWDPYRGGSYDADDQVATGVTADELIDLAGRLQTLPEDFTLHPKIAKLLEERSRMARGERRVDWGMAETLAFASLLTEGFPVRLAGEDSKRGTFNQRQASVIDVETGEAYVPLSNLSPTQGLFTAVDTPLSEAAALGFEYGYSRDFPDALVCWEAQFGDFVNGAQTIIDQFVAAGEDKWGLLSGLVMLLPHGFEGQGPEHSSARIERFLQLAAEDNIQVCQPVTSGQYFHMLRRQALQSWRKPLVVFTPKSMLRAEASSSPIEAFYDVDQFLRVMPDRDIADAHRILVCSGKIFHELRRERERRGDDTTAIVALSQLYPFPARELEAEFGRHGDANKVMWVQEEPANMGALTFVRPELKRVLGDRHVTTVKRSASASPATGSAKAHALEQRALIDLAFA